MKMDELRELKDKIDRLYNKCEKEKEEIEVSVFGGKAENCGDLFTHNEFLRKARKVEQSARKTDNYIAMEKIKDRFRELVRESGKSVGNLSERANAILNNHDLTGDKPNPMGAMKAILQIPDITEQLVAFSVLKRRLEQHNHGMFEDYFIGAVGDDCSGLSKYIL